MKKILSILGTITLIGISTTSLVACNKPNNNENKKNDKSVPKINRPQKPPDKSSWKSVDENNLENEFKEKNDKWYILIKTLKISGSAIFKEKYDHKNKIVISNFDNYKIIQFGSRIIQQFKNKPRVFVIYRWDSIDEPETPKINDITGEIIDWN
ncbi:MAG: lipoprotein [Spiroplasma phoeniceum]|nr:MAG: lipoprotein [Spiroplasma phoeniceum]UZQ33179.1 MAG: lipoprotein [Spiroplasma phoeniceum]